MLGMGVAQSVGDAVSERMRANQAEGMEKQRQAMLVMQMAMVRERTWWIGGVTALLATALTAAGRGRRVWCGLPLFSGTHFLNSVARQIGCPGTGAADFTGHGDGVPLGHGVRNEQCFVFYPVLRTKTRYGTKVNRIRDMQQHILSDERYWFVAEKKN